jgi:hypothetical protein
MERLTYKLNAEEQKEHRSRYIQFEYLPIPDYDIKRGNYDRISTDMIYNKLGKLEDLMEKYNVNEEDIERALIVKKIIQNGSIYYEDEDGEGTYYLGPELYFDFETNEIVLSLEFDDEYCSKWEEIARLPILDYKKKYWLKEDKSE